MQVKLKAVALAITIGFAGLASAQDMVVKIGHVGPTSGGNGLSQPNFILNKEREVTAIYAGDLKGNLWKFDVSGTSATSWAPAFGSEPFFTATGPAGTVQPITVMPEISAHPDGGAMLRIEAPLPF